jgi:hypothetical protein
MKNVLIVEHNTNSLKPINESKSSKDKYILGGTFTEFDVKNRNERVYTWKKFEPALHELNERISSMGVYGEFDHPDTFDTSLKNASHLIKEAAYNEKTNSVMGKIQLLNTNWGKQARNLIDDDCPLFVSSRAAGITEANGEVTLKKLFTYDIVADPGFSSAKMECLNESCGYSNDTNFRIYEMSDESKINELFEMNKNDMVTKDQLAEYSEYLVEQISSTKKMINQAIKKGNIEPKKLDELMGFYESMKQDQNNITKYLNYLAENLQIVVNENKSLRESNKKLEKVTENLIKHNDYLAENLEKSIDYSNYLAENVDKTIEYSNYLAENVDKSIQYGEYVAEQLDKSISYSNYIAENLDRSIEFSDYLAENLNNSIEYSEYIAENVDTNIAYSEYIAEHLDDGLAYTDYIAEQLDKSIGYSKMIAEKLNTDLKSSKLFENMEEEEEMEDFPMPGDAGLEEVENDELEPVIDEEDLASIEDGEITDTEEGEEDDANCRVVCDDDEETEETEETEDVIDDSEISLDETPEMEEMEEMEEEEVLEESNQEIEEEDDCEECDEETELSRSINKLIEEAKKREASKTNEHHFLTFLSKSQIDSFYSLTKEDQESVVAHINEKRNYYSKEDVLLLIQEALSKKGESLEDRLIRLMPEEVQETWGKISESAKTSILSQSRLHPSSKWDEETIEHFWLTRKFPIVKENRELLSSEEKLIQEDKLSDDAFSQIMEKFGRI